MKHLSFLISIFLLSYNTFSQVPHPSSGTIKQFVNFPSRYVEPRNIDVWLPENYSPAKNYAVLYMQDGQMLFDSTITWDHQAWDADETLSRLMDEKKIRNTIIVGIWSNGKYRHAEYSPQKALDKLSGKDKTELMTLLPDGPMGDNYLKFLVTELKPFIDSSFSTLKDQKNTFIAGSSMGGLISMYALCEYPSVFYGAACISTHWTVLYRATENSIPSAILDYMKEHLPSPVDHKIYFDHGTATLDSMYAPFQLKADEIMKAKGYSSDNWMTKVFPGEDHSEIAWRKRFALPATFLLKE